MHPHKRLLALDYGTKKIGMAQSDPLGMFAQPVGTFDLEGMFRAIDAILAAEGIEKILVGYPLSDHGAQNRMTAVVDRFITDLTKAYPLLPVEKRDEHRSSREAMQILVSAGTSRKQRAIKGRIDRTAACIILQDYLDSHPRKQPHQH